MKGVEALSCYVSKKAAALAQRAKALGLVLTIDKNAKWRLYYGTNAVLCESLRDIDQRLRMMEWVLLPTLQGKKELTPEGASALFAFHRFLLYEPKKG